MITVQEVCDEARQVFLNDAEEDIFTNAILIPFVKRAYDELQNQLALNGHQITEEVSAVIEVPANTKAITGLPSDMIEPISVEERANDSVLESDWSPMTKVNELPLQDQGDAFGVWQWRENEIKVLGSNSAREIRIKYLKFQVAIVDSTSQISVLNSKTYLSARAAALAAGHVGGNEMRAGVIDAEAIKALNVILGITVKSEQVMGVRRKPFRGRG